MVDVTMCNTQNERDAWFMLTSLWEIEPQVLEQFEEDAMREVDTSKQFKELSAIQKRKFTALEVIRLLRGLHKEL